MSEPTPEQKTYIDSLSYEEMLRRWRFAPLGDLMFQGETGRYFADRMEERRRGVDHASVSKRLGWGDE